MPLYEYQCDACNHNFEIVHSIHDEALLRCPNCDKHKLRRIITGGLYASVKKSDNEITVGHLADRNRSRFSNDQKEMLTEKRELNKGRAPKKEPEIVFGDPKVDTTKMNSKEKEKYVMTGEAPSHAKKD